MQCFLIYCFSTNALKSAAKNTPQYTRNSQLYTLWRLKNGSEWTTASHVLSNNLLQLLFSFELFKILFVIRLQYKNKLNRFKLQKVFSSILVEFSSQWTCNKENAIWKTSASETCLLQQPPTPNYPFDCPAPDKGDATKVSTFL